VLPLTRALLGMPGCVSCATRRAAVGDRRHEISRATGFQASLQQADIPVREQVQAVCEMLGYDPYYLACEGRVVAVVAEADAAAALAAWRELPEGREAALIGRMQAGRAQVVLHTPLGGTRILDELEDDPLPRIC
jgi:Hydrogenase maturation factor